MNERSPADPFDDLLEWDRDGQYYHYLTKWMHALNRVSRVTGDTIYNRWAIELAKTAHARFSYAPSSGGPKRMYWKMSIDLSRPLVSSMGHHDPLDGFITYHELQMSSAKEPSSPHLDLTGEILDMANICRGKSWATDDPLGIGGLLSDAYRVAQMMEHQILEETELLETLLDASRVGLDAYVQTNSLKLPPRHRLAFRELGLSAGLRAVEKIQELIETMPGMFGEKQRLANWVDTLMRYKPFIEIIEDFWLEPANREFTTWKEHGDINMVMLATSLIPDGYLSI